MTAMGMSRPRSMSALFDRLVGDRAREVLQRRVERTVRAQTRELEARWSDRLRSVQAAQPDPLDVGTRFSLEVLFGRGTAADRLLDPQRYRSLHDQLRALAPHSAASVGWSMQQAYRSLLAQEMTGLGRIAGTTYNIIGKLVAPTLLDPPDGPILEIGTLYGLFSPVLVRQFRRIGQFRDLTVIDPLAGVQIQPGATTVTDASGTPVTRAVAERNLTTGELTGGEVTVLEGYSTDGEIRAAAATRQYAVVIIDGDHSDAGVHEDLRWVEAVTRPGGVVIMDDFGDHRWAGVESATRRYLAEGGRLELIGTAATSAYLRMPDQADAS